MIDFEKLEAQKLDNFKGGEKYMFMKCGADDGANKIMQTRLVPGASIGYHTHEDNCEIMYCVAGNAVANFDGVEEPFYAGLVHYCPKGHSHGIVNNGTEDVILFAVVSNVK